MTWNELTTIVKGILIKGPFCVPYKGTFIYTHPMLARIQMCLQLRGAVKKCKTKDI